MVREFASNMEPEFWNIASKYKISWECTELLIEFGQWKWWRMAG